MAPTADQHTELRFPGATAVVRWVFAANIAVYVLQLTVLTPTDVRAQLGFHDTSVDAWWTVLSHMFVHRGLAHLAITMYTLWLFGPALESRWGSAQFASYYVLCGLGGWFLHLLFGTQGVLIGASAAVVGVALAAGAHAPDARIVVAGLVPLHTRWAVGTLVAANVFFGVGRDTSIGVSYVALIGGLATGWAYLRMARSMDIDRLRQRVAPIADEPDDVPPRAIPPRSLPRHRIEREAREVDEIVQQSQAAIAERAGTVASSPVARPAPPDSAAVELNAILDKISAHGLDALTPHERDQLQDAARRLRNE